MQRPGPSISTRWRPVSRKRKRDLVRFIKDAIRDIGGEGRRAAIEQVIESVTGKGFPRDKVREGIDMLLRHGEAMEPKQGIIQLI